MDQHIEEEGVEPEGLPATSVLGMVVGIMLILAVVVVAGVEIALGEFKSAESAAVQTTGYPLLRETTAQGQALLAGSGTAVGQSGAIRIPIQQAMAIQIRDAAPGTTEEVTLHR